ncbi:MAG: rhodanese-like domain-containing protein [Chloroflexota bacterium]
MRRRRIALLVPVPALSGCGVGMRQPARSAAGREAPRIEVQAAFDAVRAGRAVLIDVRGETSFRQKRAAGALLIPLDDIELAPADAIRRVPAGMQPILYCT